MDLLTDVFRAYYCARMNKRNTCSQVRFEMNAGENLVHLFDEIRDRTYNPGRSICFIVNYPVKREVFAAQFRDRIVHHLLFNYLSPIYEKLFINDSYSCRKGKGTLYGIDRLQNQMERCSCGWTQPCYVLKLDIKGYFMHIDRALLFEMMKPVVMSSTLDTDLVLFLLDKIIFNDPTSGCLMRGKPKEWDGLPHSKSLFYSPQGYGLPIGNLTSQLFSNIYLHELDQFVTSDLGIKYYGRYVDDFFLLSESKQRLLVTLPIIRAFLATRLRLELHPDKVYLQDCRKGVRFLGAVCRPGSRSLSSASRGKMKKSIADAWVFERNPYKLRSILQSYAGYNYHYNTTI